jgi:hypothetical protein
VLRLKNKTIKLMALYSLREAQVSSCSSSFLLEWLSGAALFHVQSFTCEKDASDTVVPNMRLKLFFSRNSMDFQ